MTINFTAAPEGGTPGYTVTWSFGNGVSATGTAVSYAYSAPGTYTVGVQLADAAGEVKETNLTIVVVAPSHASPSLISGNFGPGAALGLLVGVTAAAALFYFVERSRRKMLPGPPSPYVPPAPPAGKGRS